jgi:hypothetical protein
MDRVARASRWFVETLLRPLDALSPWASLAVVAAVTAVAMLYVVRWTSPQRVLARARARMAASLFEMRLFLDRPRLVLAAQLRLIAWTGVYLACLIPPAAVLVVPLGLVYVHLDARHGPAPFAVPATAVMRIELAPDADPRELAIEARDGVEVTARLRADDEHAVYARLAITRPGTHRITIRIAGREVTKAVAADPAADTVSTERRQGIAHVWARGIEPPIDDGPIRAIALQHPPRACDLPVPWWLYWLGLATVLALVLRRRFDVVL